MPEYDEIELIGNSIYKQISFTPTSSSTKPTHIANGLLRLSSGHYADISALYDWFALSKSSRTSSVPSKDLIERYWNMFGSPETITEQQISEYRVLLESIFNVDGATFARGTNSNKGDSVLNPVSWLLINSRVRAEIDIEKFLYRILKTPIDGQESPILDTIAEMVKLDNDDLSHIIKPICIEYQRLQGDDVSIKKIVHDDNPIIATLNPSELIIRKGFDRIYKNLVATAQLQDKLSTLERIICFASFSAVFYILSLNTIHNNANKCPILFDSYSGLSAVSRASELCFSAGKRSVEDFFVSKIEEYLSTEVPDLGTSEAELKAYILGLKVKETRSRKIEQVRNDALTYFYGYLNQGEVPLKALARSLQGLLFSSMYSATSPSEFCLTLGNKAGLVGPTANRAKKRYVATHTLLESLVLSLIDSDELIKFGLEIRDFETRLWESYGILMGFDPIQCFQRLKDAKIAQNVPGDLRWALDQNGQAILSTYISMGLAKQYADGVSMLRLGV